MISSSPAPPIASPVIASPVAWNTELARCSDACGTTSGSIAPDAGSKKLSPIRIRNIVAASASTVGRTPASVVDRTIPRAAARSRSAPIISRRRSTRSATTPPSRPTITLGMLSATRTAITPPAPPTS